MPALVDTMFYVGDTPWHQLGTEITEAPDPITALEMAGLNWEVTLEPIFLANGTEIEGRFATVRSDNPYFPLGVVGSTFRPVQNLQMAEFAQALQDAAEVPTETGGSLAGGKRVWLLTRLAEGVTVGDGGYVPYLLVANGHDGSLALRAATTMIRVVCQNTLTMALTNSVTSFAIRHTSGAEGRVQAAREALAIGYRQVDEFSAEVEKLLDKAVDDLRFDEIVETIFPMPTNDPSVRVVNKVERNREQVIARWNKDPAKGTRWGAYNAFNGYDLWDRPTGGATQRLERQASFILGHAKDADHGARALALLS